MGHLEAGINPTKVAGIFDVNCLQDQSQVRRRWVREKEARFGSTNEGEDDAIVQAHEDDRFRTS